MRGSDFAELRAFAAVVERASFARAAMQLGLSASALSQTIRQLEARLGVRLLNRTTRSVAPTSAGERLYDRISPMMREMDAAVAEAVAVTGRVAGPLRINTPGMAAAKLIAPRLGRFHRAHPDVVLDIVIDDGLSDIVAGRFDAGIRGGERLDKDVIAVRLTPDMQMMAVASPDYLAGHGEPKVPADLHRHACINWRYPVGGNIYRWEFEKDGKEFEMGVEGPLISSHQEVVLQGALQGIGILYTYDDDRIYEAIAEGRLKRVLADWSPSFPGLFLYYSNRRHPQPALRAFIDCLLDRDLAAAA
ncbi:MAG: LysR family transcriptional regulator [Phenylobacterium sp.]|uniref:LysR family transcriptional regulator n=1 Tax=Phenylobacterium sp. TaxID=1871053 RepID=UPI00262A90A6|nr:LysR family transcriptional regulator [Phenylobacterium sp.]MDB5437472.1 LysR family transcriptional regulator [Phenylobacterium sp.]MDB5496271.1 LysR family transcriptional regulator [Phenylobacterium sp.]